MLVRSEFQRQRNSRHSDDILEICRQSRRQVHDAGSVAEDMIIDTEVYHLLKFGHRKDVRRDVCNVGDETGFLRVCIPAVKRRIPYAESFELDQGVLPRCE